MKKYKSTIITIIVTAVFVLGVVYFVGGGSGGGDTSKAESLEGLLNNPAPQFSLEDRDGNKYSSENLKGKNVVLFFNEGIMCYPACWGQMSSLGADSRFQGPDVVALSVVVDSKNDWISAIRKMPELEKATMVFDTQKSVSRAFNVLATPSSMHYGSLPGHTYVLIDKQGIVRFVYDDPRMAINNDLIFSEVQKLK